MSESLKVEFKEGPYEFKAEGDGSRVTTAFWKFLEHVKESQYPIPHIKTDKKKDGK